MAVSVPYAEAYPDGTAYPTIPLGTTVVNVSSSSQLSSALSSATAGRKIVLADGSYSGDFEISGRNGSASSGISIEAANPGGAVFSSGSTFRIEDCSYLTVSGLAFPYDTAGDLFQFRGNSHHCRLTRSTFGPTSHSGSSEVATWIYVGDDCQHIRIDHNELRNKGTSGNGIRVYGNFDTFVGCKYVRIDHNIIRTVKPEVGNDKEPIRYGVSTMSRTDAMGVIERNYITDCLCEPEVISVKMARIRVTGNTLYRCAGSAVIRHGRNSVLSDNYIIDGNSTTASAGLESGGIRFYDSGHEISHNYVNATIGEDFQDPLLLDTGDAEGSSTNLSAHWRVINALVERNVLLDTPRGITIGDNYNSAPQNCTVKDNVVVNTPTGTAVTQRVAPSGGSITGNLYFASTAAASMTQGADTIWRKADYGPRLTYLEQADVGPNGDIDDSDGTGELVSGGGSGGGGTTPATVLDIGTGPTEQHFELTYAEDGTSGGSQITKSLQDIEEGFFDENYFSVVEGSADVQTLGVGGIPTPAAGPGVVLIGSDSTSTLVIDTPNTIYDGQGHTVKKIQIEADGVTVQNFYVSGAGNSGIYSQAKNVTIQNNDISNVNEGGEGDINAITFFGDGTRILYNYIHDLVDPPLNGSHTDGIQCWATPSKNSSSDVVIKGNYITGPPEDDERYIHQGIMAEGPDSEDGGGGGSGVSRNWVVDGNYFKTYGNQCLKFDDIHQVQITRNTFAGSCTKLIETGDFSTDITFYRDNLILGDYGSNGISITPTDGPGGTTGPTENAVEFRVRADAATGGDAFPRNELREVQVDGSAFTFDAMLGAHSLHTRARITNLPAADPEVIVAQLHDGTNERVSVRTVSVAGQPVLRVHINGVAESPDLANPYSVGAEFQVQIEVDDGGAVSVYYNGDPTPAVTGQLVDTGSASWSFRVGAHAQFDATSAGAATEFVTVEHRDIAVTHTGSFVSAGANAQVVLGQAFTRTAAEVALPPVTSRSWEIVSAPPGFELMAVDLSTAAGRLGWGDPIPEWSDEFNYTGSPNNAKWSVYNGVGHNGNGRRRPERANVDGEKLVIDGLTNGDTAGMRNRLDQEYGRFEVRCRSFNTGTSGEEYHPVVLIWPESNSRKQDGEYDLCENGRPQDSKLQAFMHFPGDGDQQRHFEKPGYNLADWHNFGFEWTPNHLKGFIDGEEWFSTSGGANSSRRDIQDMGPGHICLQLDNFNGDSGNRPARFEIDWVRIYTLTPTGGGGDSSEIGTAAALTWTPSVLGTYTLRYTAVTTGGTFTDEITVTVVPPPTGDQTVYPSSIPSGEKWGLPVVEVEPPAGSVPSLLGEMILGVDAYLGYQPGPNELLIAPSSIPSAESWGVPTVVVEPPPVPQDVFPDSIPSRERWGTPVVTLGAAPPDLPVTDITISLFGIDPSEGRGIPLPDFQKLTLSPERNSAGSITLDYPAEGVNFDFLHDAITNGRDVQIEIWVSGTATKALRGYLMEAQGDETDENGEVWTFGGTFLEIRMSEAIVEPQDKGPSPAQAAQLIHQRIVSGEPINDDFTWEDCPDIVTLYAPLIKEQWLEDREEDDTSEIPPLHWFVEYVGEPTNQEHANEKRELIFASATPGQVMIYLMDQARRRGTLTDVAVDFTQDFDSDGVEWPQVISTKFSPGVEYTRILDRLVELGLAEWAVEWTGTAQVLRMWVPEGRGEDLTVNDPPLVLRHGQNILDAPFKYSVRDNGTYVLVAGADGLYEDANSTTAQNARGRKIEKYTSANNLVTETAVESYAQQQLTVVTTPAVEVTHGIGMAPGTPRPIASFNVGDWVYSETAGVLTRYRVVQWTLDVNNDQSLSGTVTLNDAFADALLRLKARMDALTAGETVVGTSEGAFNSDAGVPLAPEGVVVSSDAFLVENQVSPTTGLPASAEAHAAVTIGWLPVTLNTNGSAANDLGGYKSQYAYDQTPDLWIGVEDVGPNQLSTTFDAPCGVNLRVRVAAYDRNGNVSDWSAVVQHTTAVENTPPPAPSTPTVSEYLGTIRVLWDGQTFAGVDMIAAAPDFEHIEVHMAAGSTFTPGGSTLVGHMRGPGAFSITDLPYGVEQFVRLVAVDNAGNASAPSAEGSATPGQLVNIDIGPDAISRVQIIDGEIVNAKIADLAVNDAKISSLSVGKLTAGFLFADVIMSTGAIRTGSGNTYGIFSSGGIQFYRAGINTVDLNALTGDALITGTYRSGLVGERINILPNGTLRIFGSSGSDFGEIANNGGSWRARSRPDGDGRRSEIYFNPWGFTAVYGDANGVYSRFDTGITYGVLNAPVTGIRVWTQHAPTDGTSNRFHFVHATNTGDINDSVLHYQLNDFKGDDPSIIAPGLSPEGAGITWSNNAIACTRGNGNAYVFVDGADFRALSSELQKRDIAPIMFTGGRTARDLVDSVASYQFTYDWPIEPRTVPVERRQPDGTMKVVEESVDTTLTAPPRRHFFPLAEHLNAIAPELVQTTPQGELAIGMRDVIGVLWEHGRELSRELRELRQLITGEPGQPVIVEGSVLDKTRWKQLPEGSND